VVNPPLPVQGYILPVAVDSLPPSYQISSCFEERFDPNPVVTQFHKGIDLPVGTGTPLRAFADGTIVDAGDGGSYGLRVIIEHTLPNKPYKLWSVYGHLKCYRGTEREHGKAGGCYWAFRSDRRSNRPASPFELRVFENSGSMQSTLYASPESLQQPHLLAWGYLSQ